MNKGQYSRLASLPIRLGKLITGVALVSVFLCGTLPGFAQNQRIILPEGKFYHGVYPGGPPDDENSGNEDMVRCEDIRSYVNSAGRNVSWVYFSDNWFSKSDTAFPWAKVCCIRRSGAIPFIRLMLRPDTNKIKSREKIDKYFANLERINAGEVDQALQAWGNAARDFGHPLIVEFGTEVNDKSHSWNGNWHALKPKHGPKDFSYGPQQFKQAFKRIVQQVTQIGGAANITWAFHVTAQDDPAADWNRLEAYYPEGVIDWLGVSVYGAQTPKKERDDEDNCREFDVQFEPLYRRLQALAPDKPIVILEFGETSGHPYAKRKEAEWQRCKQNVWAQNAFRSILTSRQWPMLRGFSWWNEKWQEDGVANMRIQDSSELTSVFRNFLTSEPYRGLIIDRPIFSGDVTAANSSLCDREVCSPACANP